MDPFGIPAHIPVGPDTLDSNGVETIATMDSNGTEEEGGGKVSQGLSRQRSPLLWRY